MKKDKKSSNLGDFKIHGNLTIWPKWQIVIPKSVRDSMWINPWDSLISITKCDKWLILIKAESLIEFMDYIKSEINSSVDITEIIE